MLEMSPESFDWVLDVNLKGPFFLTQAVANWMVEQGRASSEFAGCIVYVTSISSTVASTNRAEYCISKAGLSMASQAWAVRLAEYGIQVFEVRPGIIRTDMTSGVRDKYDDLIATVHDAELIDAVKRISAHPGPGEELRGLATDDNPAFAGMHHAAAHVVGASHEAFRRVWTGQSIHSANITGGLHHAMPDRASGFCIPKSRVCNPLCCHEYRPGSCGRFQNGLSPALDVPHLCPEDGSNSYGNQ
jgi:NAD(P)-dependent dehydrogenase (short-subunit alcohol dehydrogenase family)